MPNDPITAAELVERLRKSPDPGVRAWATGLAADEVRDREEPVDQASPMPNDDTFAAWLRRSLETETDPAVREWIGGLLKGGGGNVPMPPPKEAD